MNPNRRGQLQVCSSSKSSKSLDHVCIETHGDLEISRCLIFRNPQLCTCQPHSPTKSRYGTCLGSLHLINESMASGVQKHRPRSFGLIHFPIRKASHTHTQEKGEKDKIHEKAANSSRSQTDSTKNNGHNSNLTKVPHSSRSSMLPDWLSIKKTAQRRTFCPKSHMLMTKSSSLESVWSLSLRGKPWLSSCKTVLLVLKSRVQSPPGREKKTLGRGTWRQNSLRGCKVLLAIGVSIWRVRASWWSIEFQMILIWEFP